MNKITALIIIGLAVLSIAGCKSDTETQKYLDHVKIVANQIKFTYVTTFTDSVEVDMEGEFPVGKHGSIVFFNDDKRRFNIGFEASFDLFKDESLKIATALPNGAKFPMIVAGPMYQFPVKDESGKFKLFAYVDQINGTGDKKLAGLALQMDNIKNNFPQISITQSYFVGERKVASFTLYGPREQNGQMVAGGIFVVGDLNALVDGKNKTWTNEPTIHGPESSKFKSDDAKLKLYDQVKEALAENGIYLKF